jgi:hypothetical protein
MLGENRTMDVNAQQTIEERKEKTKTGKQTKVTIDLVYVLFIAVITILSAVYAFQRFYSSSIGPISNIVPSIVAASALAISLNNEKRYGFKIRKRKLDRIWLCFSIGTACWVLAEASWAAYYFAGVDVPYPGVPDIFYIAAYLPMTLAVLFYLRSFSGAMTKKRRFASAVAIIISIALVLGIVVRYEVSNPHPLLTTATDLAYPVADIILLSLTILSLAIFIGGSMGKWWSVLAGAIILDIVGDELFLYQVANGTYYNGNIDDLIYVWAYLLFALAYYMHRKQL